MRACYVLSAARVLSSMQQRLRGGASKCRTAASVRAAVGAPPPHPTGQRDVGPLANSPETDQNCYWNNIALFEFGIRIVGVPFPHYRVFSVHKNHNNSQRELQTSRLKNSVKNMVDTSLPQVGSSVACLCHIVIQNEKTKKWLCS